MILNLTQHPATVEQLNAGVVDTVGTDNVLLKDLLTFSKMPDSADIDNRAREITKLAKNALFGQPEKKAMIGGALWLMAPLTFYLKAAGIQPVFAFSQRKSVERTLDNGSVQKVNVFRHIGFVEA